MAPAAPESSSGELQADALLAACPGLNSAARLWIAFSGGLDSTVLLHLVSTLRQQGALTLPVQALHIHHGLQSAADAWEQHCAMVCQRLDLPFHSVRAQVDARRGRSIEEAARAARHAVFAETLGTGDVLLLAHHQDDQVETVLFRLLRGSGPAGVAGIPRERACGQGRLVRPLLDWPRRALADYAQAHKLQWIEDGSNQEQRYDRNFLRATIIPQLQQRWPGLNTAMARSARLSGEAGQLLDELAAQDLQACMGPLPNRLQTAELLRLSEIRQRNLLRCWLQSLESRMGLAQVTHQVLQRAVSEVVLAKPGADPELVWGQGVRAGRLRRFKGMLYALPVLPGKPAAMSWDVTVPLQLPAPLGTLELGAGAAGGSSARHRELEVRFRRGGERVCIAGRPARSLKQFLQEAAVPPWLREHIPLLYAGAELLAVGDIPIAAAWLPQRGEKRCPIRWSRSELDCGY